MRSIRFAVALAGVLLACKSTPPPQQEKKPGVCDLAPAICERNCARCDDVEACFANGGECLMQAGANIYFADIADQGPDVFTPGCHYMYTDNVCTQNAQFINGDLCVEANPQIIVEYTVTKPCHDGCADVLECPDECKKVNRTGGKCQAVPGFCGVAKDSAMCVCDPPPPPPPPEENPT